MPSNSPAWVIIVRWSARLTALVLGAFLLFLIIGNWMPPWRVLLPFVVVFAGFAIGWKYELVGAILLLGAFVYFNAREFSYNGRLLRFGAFHLLLVPALLYLIAWSGQTFNSQRKAE